MLWHSNQHLRPGALFGRITFDSFLPGGELWRMAAMAPRTVAISRCKP